MPNQYCRCVHPALCLRAPSPPPASCDSVTPIYRPAPCALRPPQSLEEHIWRRSIRSRANCPSSCKAFFTAEWLAANHDALFPVSDVPGAYWSDTASLVEGEQGPRDSFCVYASVDVLPRQP
jgi:hypothetical protein